MGKFKLMVFTLHNILKLDFWENAKNKSGSALVEKGVAGLENTRSGLGSEATLLVGRLVRPHDA